MKFYRITIKNADNGKSITAYIPIVIGSKAISEVLPAPKKKYEIYYQGIEGIPVIGSQSWVSVHPVMNWMYQFEVSNGSVWETPVSVIAVNRADTYAHYYGDDVMLSLMENTLPLFESDAYEIQNWAQNNMSWEDVVSYAIMIEEPRSLDMRKEWWDPVHSRVAS